MKKITPLSIILKAMNKYQKKLKFLIDRSNFLYDKYKKEPVYINALLIKNVNCKIIKFLLTKGHFFNSDSEINLILDHFEVWFYQFIEHEKNVISLSDKFIFEKIEQASNYPKQAIENLLRISTK